MGIEINDINAPQKLWDIFHDFTQTPRPSKHEEKIRTYIIELAKSAGYETRSDKIGNIAISLPKQNSESEKTIVIQNHIDMVTDAIPGKNINFQTDPIQTYVDGDWLRAEGTTLGADNGIGCAAALALMFDKEISRPALELLFTIDEETGLTGALELDPELTSGDIILNLDTEEWGSLYVGCAGGVDYDFQTEFKSKKPNLTQYKLSLEGFAGGHSGVDIHRFRENCSKKLIEAIYLISENQNIEVAEFRSGKAHNIIPRDAFVIIGLESMNAAKDLVDSLVKTWKGYVSNEDLEFRFSFDEVESESEVLELADMNRFLSFMNLFPHGVYSMIRSTVDSDKDPLVAISNNCAVTILKKGKFYLRSSLRFFNREEAFSLEAKFRNLAKLFSMDISRNSEYPSWNPNFNSQILEKAKNVYQSLYNKKPHVKAIHAGLECGILLDRFKSNAEALSFGPTIVDAHSPDERVQISTVSEFWKFLTKFLSTL